MCHGRRYVRNKPKGTVNVEPLTTCELVDGGQFVEQVVQHDDTILRQIDGKDCVAKEVRYHASCYREYTCRPLTRKKESEDAAAPKPYQKLYYVFCKEVIEPQIIRGKGVLRLT